MSNLGLYQWFTTAAKKVGGPLILLALFTGGGFLGGVGLTSGAVCLYSKKAKQRNSKTIYHVLTDGVSNEGLEFKINDEFKVLNRDKQAVLIEKIGDDNNPYFVAYDFLKSISDYK